MILLQSNKIKAYENLKSLCEQTNETPEFADALWADMLQSEELLAEFNYYVVNRTLEGKCSCCGLTLLDLYFGQMNKYNRLHDLGKNPGWANKERMVLHAFREMADMKKDPKLYEKREENERASTDYLGTI